MLYCIRQNIRGGKLAQFLQILAKRECFTIETFPASLSFILICAHSKIRITEVRVGFKAANHESFPYIMHIVDEPRKFSPSNVLSYTVYQNMKCWVLSKTS